MKNSKLKILTILSISVILLNGISFALAGFALAKACDPCCVPADCQGAGEWNCSDVGTPCEKEPDGSFTGAGVCAPQGKEIICPFTRWPTLQRLAEEVIKYIFWIALAVCPLMIAVGAFLFLTSAGDPGRVKLGQKIIFWSVIGLAVLIFSRSIYAVIKSIVGG